MKQSDYRVIIQAIRYQAGVNVTENVRARSLTRNRSPRNNT